MQLLCLHQFIEENEVNMFKSESKFAKFKHMRFAVYEVGSNIRLALSNKVEEVCQ